MMIRKPKDEIDLGLFNANVLKRLGLSQRRDVNFPKYKIKTITFMFILKTL